MIKIGVIGYGYWGPNLVRNFMETRHCKVSVVCDSDAKVLNKVKLKYPHVQTVTDYRDLLNSKEVDAVVIATPASTHYQLARAALNHAKHVFIEKPFATNLRAAQWLIEEAKRKSLTLMVDHTFVYSNKVQMLKKKISEIGQIRYFDSIRVNLGLFQPDINVIWDLAPHDFSILLYLLDEDPTEVMAVGSAHVRASVENTAYVVAKFRNDLITHFHFNWLSPVKIRQTLICGTERMIVYNDLDTVEPIKIYDYGVHHRKVDKKEIMVNYRTGDVYSPRVERGEALQNVCRDFIQSILEKRSPISNGAFGLRVMRLLKACDRSLQKNSKFIKVAPEKRRVKANHETMGVV